MIDESPTYHVAMKSFHKIDWQNVMIEDLNSLSKNQT